MASQVGNVSRDQECTVSSTKCANDGVAMDGTDARSSTEKSMETRYVGLGDLCSVQEYGAAINMRAGYTGFVTAESRFLPCGYGFLRGFR